MPPSWDVGIDGGHWGAPWRASCGALYGERMRTGAQVAGLAPDAQRSGQGVELALQPGELLHGLPFAEIGAPAEAQMPPARQSPLQDDGAQAPIGDLIGDLLRQVLERPADMAEQESRPHHLRRA